MNNTPAGITKIKIASPSTAQSEVHQLKRAFPALAPAYKIATSYNRMISLAPPTPPLAARDIY